MRWNAVLGKASVQIVVRGDDVQDRKMLSVLVTTPVLPPKLTLAEPILMALRENRIVGAGKALKSIDLKSPLWAALR
jgi:hypothetical protein